MAEAGKDLRPRSVKAKGSLGGSEGEMIDPCILEIPTVSFQKYLTPQKGQSFEN